MIIMIIEKLENGINSGIQRGIFRGDLFSPNCYDATQLHT